MSRTDRASCALTRRAVCLALPALLAGAPVRASNFAGRLVRAARARTLKRETYDGAYRAIAYPMGDVPDDRGVCTDVVIRAYRALGVDLQQLIHEDMSANFAVYPRRWGLPRPDPNIDHRRVPNMQVFFSRAGAALEASRATKDCLPGDLITWTLPGNLPHIGVVSDRSARLARRPLIIHNIGAGPVEEDMMFDHPVTGHYRYVR